MRRYLQPYQVAQVVQVLQEGTSIHKVAKRFAACPSTDSRRPAITQGELDRAVEWHQPSMNGLEVGH